MPSHRRGAATPQTAPRRRNLRWTASCTHQLSSTEFSTDESLLGQWTAKGRTRRPHPFFSSLLNVPVTGDPPGGGRVDAEALQAWTAALVARVGTPPDIAADVAEILL